MDVHWHYQHQFFHYKMPDKVIVLNEGPPWGFRMTGGKNTGSPLKISRVNNAGKAAKSGVREGFLIESINSASVDHLTSNEAQALIRNSGDTLTIGVYRQPKINTEKNDQKHETDAKSGAGIRPKPTEAETPNKKSVWSPELKHKSLDLENISIKVEKKQPRTEIPPVWTPNSSPTPERKSYKPVRFESPTLSRKTINVDTKKVPSKPPVDLPILSPPLPPPPPPSLPLKTQGDENVHSTDRRLPRVQSPTVTLLQKAREGQLPKGSAYLNSEEYNMDKENKTRGSTVKQYASRREYDGLQSDEKKQKKMVEISQKKYEGIGPTTKEGVPIVLRSEIKEPNQPKWYKQMYESLHKFQSDGPKARKGDGYSSEPEKGYESDFGENRLFQNLNGEYTRNVSMRRSVSPVKCGQDRYKNQPRPIENYEPGHSSIAEKETKQWWDEVMNTFDGDAEHKIPPPQNRSSSRKSNLAQALKESGYDSDSTLVFKRQENQSQCLSPTEQKTAYKVIQNGGEVPFQGLRKTFPERPKGWIIMFYSMNTNMHINKSLTNYENIYQHDNISFKKKKSAGIQ
ncbi:hypothetical protein ACI65C_000646 [Semiaphis heraclei]